MKTGNALLAQKVNEIYNWLDEQIKQHTSVSCKACGRCCDFETFDHLLFVTTPELIFLKEKLGPENIKEMTSPICPYNQNGKCSIYQFRFSGCRIFNCSGDKDFQSRITEQIIRRLKNLCEEHDVPYYYADLKTALNKLI